MKISITIATDEMLNGKFEDGVSIEIAEILKELSSKIEAHPNFSEGLSMPILDIDNYKEVGWFEIN